MRPSLRQPILAAVAVTWLLPSTVTQQGATQTFDGTLPIKRSQFDIGSGEWKDTSVAADEVTIRFHLVEAKK